MDIMMDHLGSGLFLILILSLPAVLTAASVGLVVGILQAVTQVQEQTISAAPKILLVFLLIIFGGGLMMTMMTEYLRESAIIAFQEIPAEGNFILPPQTDDKHQQRIDAFFAEQVRAGNSKAREMMNQSPGDSGGFKDSTAQVGTAIKPKPKATVSEEMFLKKQGTR
jgi:flagellar biosynthesis protein FliQ